MGRPPLRFWRPLVAVAFGLILTSCTATQASEGTITVLGAASLTEAFDEIASAFEADHEGIRVHLSFDGSARLATSIVEGAPADLFASADQATMDTVRDADRLTGEQSIFATNVLQIVVPDGNPLDIESLADLGRSDVTLSLCGAEVPCGAYAAQAFERAGLATPAAGDQGNVKGVLAQVQLGEADAGIVYRTDVLAAEGVEGVDLDAAARAATTYAGSVLADASNPEVAAAFLGFLLSERAQAILNRFGFGPP